MARARKSPNVFTDASGAKLRIERALPESKDRALLVRDVLRNLGQPQAAVPQAA